MITIRYILVFIIMSMSLSAFAATYGGKGGNLYMICEREISRDIMLRDVKSVDNLSFSTKHWCRTFMPAQIDYLIKYKREEIALYKQESPDAYNKTKLTLIGEDSCLSFVKEAAKSGKYASYDDLPMPEKERCKAMRVDFLILKSVNKLGDFPATK